MANNQISVLLNENKWSDFPCDLLEELVDATNGRKFVRIKFPDGDIKRVYHDRIRPFSNKPSEDKPMSTQQPNHYNPWSECTDAEVYERNNEFSSVTTVCKTIVIIDKANSQYYSINTYNDIAKAGKMTYVIKDLKKLVHKLEKKGYVKVIKGSVAAK